MRETFASMKLRPDTLAVIDQANNIIAAYQAQGYRMTLRQLYYQFVSQNFITNEEKSYKRLASIVSDGRLAGLIDWDAIEDRGRTADVPHHYKDTDHMLRTLKGVAANYTLDKWKGQKTYVELWVEKQALAGVLEPLARQHHVTLMVNKGYSSQSSMYESAKRFRAGMGTEGERDDDADEQGLDPWYGLRSDREGVLLYLGDHDPSGEDMVRDIRDRMTMFGVDAESFGVVKVALTTAQVRQYNPPPNPAKLTDPRAEAYIAQHGRHSWEVDSLPPNILARLVTAAITACVDAPTLVKVQQQEAVERKKLAKALEKITV